MATGMGGRLATNSGGRVSSNVKSAGAAGGGGGVKLKNEWN